MPWANCGTFCSRVQVVPSIEYSTLTFLTPKPMIGLDLLVGVPHPQFGQLIGLVELELNPVRLPGPVLIHIVIASLPCRSPVMPEPLMVFCGGMPARAGSRGRDVRDRIGIGLNREGPDVALGHGARGLVSSTRQ